MPMAASRESDGSWLTALRAARLPVLDFPFDLPGLLMPGHPQVVIGQSLFKVPLWRRRTAPAQGGVRGDAALFEHNFHLEGILASRGRQEV
jgi:hypothetical protein